VGQRTAQPALVHVILGAALGGGGNRLLRLALGADEQDAPAGSGSLAQRHQRRVQQGHRLGQIEDVDVVARAIDVGRHLRIPALLAMAEMGAALEQLTHGKIRQSHGLQSPLPVGQMRGLIPFGTTGRRRRNTRRKPPAHARWRAYKSGIAEIARRNRVFQGLAPLWAGLLPFFSLASGPLPHFLKGLPPLFLSWPLKPPLSWKGFLAGLCPGVGAGASAAEASPGRLGAMRTPPLVRAATFSAKASATRASICTRVWVSSTRMVPMSFLVTSPWRQISGSSHLGSALRSRPTLTRNQTPSAISFGRGGRGAPSSRRGRSRLWSGRGPSCGRLSRGRFSCRVS